MNDEDKSQVALWRYSVLGPLVSARLEHGDIQRLLELAASRTYERWDGKWVQLKKRTIEDWF